MRKEEELTKPDQEFLDEHCRLVRFLRHNSDGDTMTIQWLSAAGQKQKVCDLKKLEMRSARAQLHQHDYYELMIFLKGEGYQNIEHERHYYPVGGCCFMNRNIRHREERDGFEELAFIQMSKAYLESLLIHPRYFHQEQQYSLHKLQSMMNDENAAEKDRRFIDLIPRKEALAVHEKIAELFEDLWEEYLSPSAGSSLLTDALLTRLLGILFDDSKYMNKSVHFVTDREWELFQTITAYLQKNHGHISRSEIEDSLHYTGDYLYKIVKKHTGLSLYDYGMKICMAEAAQMLEESAMPVSDIIQKLAFTNHTQFYRMFQKIYGISPAKYRRECEKAVANA